MASHVLAVLSKRLDDFLIGYFLGPVALGYYAVAYRLIRMGTKLLGGTVQRVAFPVFARMQGDKQRLQRAFYAATRLTMLVALPGFSVLIVLAPELLPAVFGEQWSQSVPVMQVLAVMGILRALVGFNVAILVSEGKPFWKLVIQAIETAVMVGGFIIAVSWGIVAVAVARLIAGALLTPVWFGASKRLSGIEAGAFLRSCSVPFLGTLAMVGAVYLVKRIVPDTVGLYSELSMLGATAAVVYLAAVQLLSPGSASEALELYRTLRKKKGRKQDSKPAPQREPT
jgi:PST family polysaccharide transporter